MANVKFPKLLVVVAIVVLMLGIMTAADTTSTFAQSPQLPQYACATELSAREPLVQVNRGKVPADLLIQGATVLDVFNKKWQQNWDIVIKGERIAWIGPSGAFTGKAAKTVNAYGYFVVPGFVEPHKHIESTNVDPIGEAALVLPKGNTTTVEDSHEFGNVTSDHNMEFWLAAEAAGSPLKVFPNIGSAIPPTPFEFTGGYYGEKEVTRDLTKYWCRVPGIGEVMDTPSWADPTMPGYKRMQGIIEVTQELRAVVEGHGSRMYAYDQLNMFSAEGLSSNHEISQGNQVIDDVSRNQHVELRGSNVDPVVTQLLAMGFQGWPSVSLTTDDRNADDTSKLGASDYNVQRAIDFGVPVIEAYSMASLYPATHWRINHLVGSIAPGTYADLVFLADPKKVVGGIHWVYAKGKLVGQDGKLTVELPKISYPAWATKTVNYGRTITAADFAIKTNATTATVTAVLLEPSYFLAEPMTITVPVKDGVLQPDYTKVTKFSIVDRYHGKDGGVASMLWQKAGPMTPDTAWCSTIAHDNHNTQCVSNSDTAAAMAANELAKINGGFVIVSGGKVATSVSLEIGGLMSARPADQVAADLAAFYTEAAKIKWQYVPSPNPTVDPNGIAGLKGQIFRTLTCEPWKWVLVAPYKTCPSGFVNVTTGECRKVVDGQVTNPITVAW